MNDQSIIRVIVYILSLAASFFALSCVDFSRFIYSKKSIYAQFLLVIFSMALAYLVAEFLLGLSLY